MCELLSSRDSASQLLRLLSRLNKYDSASGHNGLYDINAEPGMYYYSHFPTVSSIDKLVLIHQWHIGS